MEIHIVNCLFIQLCIVSVCVQDVITRLQQPSSVSVQTIDCRCWVFRVVAGVMSGSRAWLTVVVLSCAGYRLEHVRVPGPGCGAEHSVAGDGRSPHPLPQGHLRTQSGHAAGRQVSIAHWTALWIILCAHKARFSVSLT